MSYSSRRNLYQLLQQAPHPNLLYQLLELKFLTKWITMIPWLSQFCSDGLTQILLVILCSAPASPTSSSRPLCWASFSAHSRSWLCLQDEMILALFSSIVWIFKYVFIDYLEGELSKATRLVNIFDIIGFLYVCTCASWSRLSSRRVLFSLPLKLISLQTPP